METSTLTYGQKIKRYRLVNDIRQEDMSEKMGVSRATLINYEKGYTAINIDVLNRLKKYYPDFDVELEDSEKPKIINEDSIDFRILARVLNNNRKYILLITLIFVVFGVGSSFLFKKYYNSEISLYPAKSDLSQGFGQFQSLAANFGMNTANNDQNFNIPDVVMSRLIASKAVLIAWNLKNGQSVDLINLWGLNKSSWINIFSNELPDSIVVLENAIKKFNKHIKVSEDRLSGLIKITTTFQDPYIAAGVANFIGNEVEFYIQKENSAQSTKEKLFISDRLLIVKKELETTELLLKDFKERNRGYDDSPELFMIYSQLFREVEAKKEVYLTLQQQLELARIEEVKQSPILHILDHAVPSTKKSAPNRVFFLITSFFLGLFLSSLQTIFRY